MSKTKNSVTPERYYLYCADMEKEYRTLLEKHDEHELSDDQKIVDLLIADEWGNRGAAALVMLVRRYGAFILRHALALAKAMDIEDGELGL